MRLPDWDPEDLFYKRTNIQIKKIERGGLFGGDSYTFYHDKKFTVLGKLVAKLPGILTLPILIPYYVGAYIIWVFYEFLSVVISLLTEPYL